MSRLYCLRVHSGKKCQWHLHISEFVHWCFKVEVTNIEASVSCVPYYFGVLVVVMSAVLVVSLPGHLIRLPPAAMRTLSGSDFCGLKSTTMRAYAGGLPAAYIFAIYAWFIAKMQFSLWFSSYRCLGPCVRFPFRIQSATFLVLQGRHLVPASCTR